MSAWRLKCTKHMGSDSDVVPSRIDVRTEDRWVKLLGEKCELGCGENSNEPTCFVKDRELNE